MRERMTVSDERTREGKHSRTVPEADRPERMRRIGVGGGGGAPPPRGGGGGGGDGGGGGGGV